MVTTLLLLALTLSLCSAARIKKEESDSITAPANPTETHKNAIQSNIVKSEKENSCGNGRDLNCSSDYGGKLTFIIYSPLVALLATGVLAM